MINRKLQKLTAFFAVLLFSQSVSAQLFIDNATFFIQSGATVTVQGDVTSNVDIQGPGKVLLKGSTNQNVNMNGFTIPNLEMDNAANATLTGNARIGSSMLFTNGKIIQGNFNCRIADVATVTGSGTAKFFETSGTGQLLKEVSSNLTNYVLPVGIGSTYYPVSITTSGTYSSASVGVQGKTGAEPNKHPRSTDYLNLYWPITRTGITGTVDATGTYTANFTGTESDLRGIFWNGTNWSLTGSAINTTTDNATATITGNGDLYAMNRFLLSKLRVILQGPFNGTDMNDGLRTGTNLIPLSDPYRSAPYSTNFTHVNNTTAEVANAAVFNNAALTGDNIVDWVFVELRQGTSPGNTITQTRSGLVQRDGDIVDVDGVSPLYFKNLDANTNYSFGVRHRNHLGLFTNTAAAGNLFSLDLTGGSLIDLSTAAASVLNGAAGTAYGVSSGKNVLFAGNVNMNTGIRWNAPNSDKDYLLSNVLGGNQATVLSNVYSHGDVNLNRGVRWNAPNSDKDYILATPLAGSQANVRTQATPN